MLRPLIFTVLAAVAAAFDECPYIGAWMCAGEGRATAMYNEAVVLETAPGTYFSLLNFNDSGAGYIGIQELEDGRHVAIFSVWDSYGAKDDLFTATPQEPVRLVRRGEGVRTKRFGGEGTGGQSMCDWPWKVGEPVRVLLVQHPDTPGYRKVSGYIYDNAAQQWKFLSCWRRSAGRGVLGNAAFFVEDFLRNGDSVTHARTAAFGPCWLWEGGRWLPADKGKFFAWINVTAEREPATDNFSMKEQGNTLLMSTGGGASPAGGIAGKTELPLAAPAHEPDAAATALVQAPAPEQDPDVPQPAEEEE